MKRPMWATWLLTAAATAAVAAGPALTSDGSAAGDGQIVCETSHVSRWCHSHHDGRWTAATVVRGPGSWTVNLVDGGGSHIDQPARTVRLDVSAAGTRTAMVAAEMIAIQEGGPGPIVCDTPHRQICDEVRRWLDARGVCLETADHQLILTRRFGGPTGLYVRSTRTLWVDPARPAAEVIATVAHEVGHMLDHELLTDPMRERWIEVRGGDPTDPWRVPADGRSEPWSEDFAEVYAWWSTGRAAASSVPGGVADQPATVAAVEGEFRPIFGDGSGTATWERPGRTAQPPQATVVVRRPPPSPTGRSPAVSTPPPSPDGSPAVPPPLVTSGDVVAPSWPSHAPPTVRPTVDVQLAPVGAPPTVRPTVNIHPSPAQMETPR